MGGREFARALVVAGVMMLAACSGTDAPAVEDADPVVVEPSPPTVTLLASATQGLVGEPIRLDWTSSHADHCDAAGAWSGSRPLAGTEQLSIDAAGPAVYELTCTSSEGSATASATVTGLLAPTLTLVSSASSAVLGSEVMLSWNAEDATECEASGSEDWQGSRPVTGEQAVRISQADQRYALRCTGDGGAVSRDVAVAGVPMPMLSFTAVPSQNEAPATLQLSWAATASDACLASGDWSGEQPVAGSVQFDLTEPRAYRFALRCTGQLPALQVEETVDFVLADPLDAARALFEQRQRLREAAGLGES